MPQSIGHWLTIAERRAQNVAFKWRSKAPPPNGTIPGQNTYEVDAGRAGRNKADCVVQEDASKEGRAHRVTPTLPLNPAKEHWVGWWIKVTGLPALISFRNLASFCAGYNLRLTHPALQLLCFCPIKDLNRSFTPE